MFPEINRIRKISTYVGVFGGLNRTENCGFGPVSTRSGTYMTELCEMENLCGDDYPKLRTRKKRSVLPVADYVVTSNLIACNGGLVYTTSYEGGKLIVSGHAYAINGYDSTADGEGGVGHRITLFGNRVIIFPEKQMFDLSEHTFSPMEFESTTQTVDGTALNVATYNTGNYTKRSIYPLSFKDFSIEKVALDDNGVPLTMNFIYEKACGLEDYAKQTNPSVTQGDDEVDPWQGTYYSKWNTIRNGETVEAQGESPSGVYICTDIKTGATHTINGTQYNSFKNLRKFTKVDAYYVKISRNNSGVTPFAGFRKGDWVKISGMSHSVADLYTDSPAEGQSHDSNAKWKTKSTEWGNYLQVLNNNTFKVYYADDNCIVIKANIDKSVPYKGPMKVSRVMPAIDSGLMIEVNNRLWACSSAHNEIYSCKQGDPTNWQAYGDGIATDSFAATVGCEGVFTGIARQNDSVIFFKENWIIKLFGTKPSNYTLATYNVPGVEQGSGKSVVWVNGVLYYLSHLGVCQYQPGGMPVVVSEKAFGHHKYRNGVAGRHRDKYVLSAQNELEEWELFVLDTRSGLWHKEDDMEMQDCVTYNNVLYFMSATDNNLRCADENNHLLTGADAEDDDIAWSFETPNFYDNDFGKKYISKIQIAVKAADDMKATVWAQFGYEKPWVELRQLRRQEHRHCIIHVPVRRSDFLKLRVEGVGECEISGIQIDFARGSEKVWPY